MSTCRTRSKDKQFDWLAEENRESSLYEMFERNVPLVDVLIRKYFPYDIGDDDVRAEAMEWLWRACQRYDPTLGTTFSTYATTAVVRGVKQYIGEVKMKHYGLDVKTDADFTDAEQEEQLEDNDYLASLPNEEMRQTAADAIMGLSAAKSAKKRGVPEYVMYQRRHKLKQYLEERYGIGDREEPI